MVVHGFSEDLLTFLGELVSIFPLALRYEPNTAALGTFDELSGSAPFVTSIIYMEHPETRNTCWRG